MFSPIAPAAARSSKKPAMTALSERMRWGGAAVDDFGSDCDMDSSGCPLYHTGKNDSTTRRRKLRVLKSPSTCHAERHLPWWERKCQGAKHLAMPICET